MMFLLYKTYLLSFVGRDKGAYGKPGNPESGIQNPESGIQNPESRIPNPESRIRIQNPESRIQNPEPGIRNPESGTATGVNWETLNRKQLHSEIFLDI